MLKKNYYDKFRFFYLIYKNTRTEDYDGLYEHPNYINNDKGHQFLAQTFKAGNATFNANTMAAAELQAMNAVGSVDIELSKIEKLLRTLDIEMFRVAFSCFRQWKDVQE
jgi:hypothetical protein